MKVWVRLAVGALRSYHAGRWLARPEISCIEHATLNPKAIPWSSGLTYFWLSEGHGVYRRRVGVRQRPSPHTTYGANELKWGYGYAVVSNK